MNILQIIYEGKGHCSHHPKMFSIDENIKNKLQNEDNLRKQKRMPNHKEEITKEVIGSLSSPFPTSRLAFNR